jgi:hypothetical protein
MPSKMTESQIKRAAREGGENELRGSEGPKRAMPIGPKGSSYMKPGKLTAKAGESKTKPKSYAKK